MNCIITICDYHKTDGQTETSELTTTAEIKGKANDYRIIYNEQSEELKGCKTTVHVENGCKATVTREGAYNTEMVMEKGNRTLCTYNTPVGQIMMGVYTSAISSQYTEKKKTVLDFSYTLDFNNELLSENRIKITAKY